MLNLIRRIAFLTAYLICPLTLIQAQSPPTTLISINRFGTGGSNQGIGAVRAGGAHSGPTRRA